MEKDSCIFIHGLGLAGYRSFGPDLQRLAPFTKINVLIGPNNSGKSNVLRFLHFHYPHWFGENPHSKAVDTGVDSHRGRSAELQVAIPIPVTNLDTFIPRYLDVYEQLGSARQSFVKTVLAHESFTGGSEFCWFDYRFDTGKPQLVRVPTDKLMKDINANVWRELGQGIANIENASAARVFESIIPRLLPNGPDPFATPPIRFIPAIRSVQQNLVTELAGIQSPDYKSLEKEEIFASINRFIQEVTGHPSARLYIPHPPEAIEVDIGGKRLPLHLLGTGIHEVILLAAEASVRSGEFLCVEEPEIHLHATLQKKLIRYLADSTSNQYLIATHSPHFLDYERATVFEISEVNQETRVRLASSSQDKFTVCTNLGYRSSDLFQANCVIWVEGPSERVYIQSWINAVDSTLVEGIHYTIMFYGGRLLSQLSAEDPEVTEFISLRGINRNVVVVMDSDKDSASASINSTKKRVQSEIAKEGGLAWVTQGREVENYVDPDRVRTALKEMYDDFEKLPPRDLYSKVYQFKKGKYIDKVRLAHHITEHGVELDVMDLRERVTELVAFIQEANGLNASSDVEHPRPTIES